MSRRYLRLLTFSMLLFSSTEVAAQVAGKGGIVKGTVIAAGKPASDVVVSIEGVAPETSKAVLSSAKPKKAIMDQKGLTLSPFVLAVVVGTTVEFPNHDTVWHNIVSRGGAQDFDLGLYPPGQSRSATFDKPGVDRLLCSGYPNMEAFIVVKDHPYFSTTDKTGNYRIDGVPLGTYRVTAWHPQRGTSEARVELLREGEVADIDFDMTPK